MSKDSVCSGELFQTTRTCGRVLESHVLREHTWCLLRFLTDVALERWRHSEIIIKKKIRIEHCGKGL